MTKNRCPYIGLVDDPNTALGFPSRGNLCYRAQPHSTIKGSHQVRFCLTGQHTNCPVFNAARPVPMPASLAGSRIVPIEPARRPTLFMLVIPILIAGAAAIIFTWNVFGDRFRGQLEIIPHTGANVQGLPGWALIPDQEAPLPPPPTSTPTEEPAVIDCPPPPGWVKYTVAPTDSLFRLSVIYGLNVDTLKEVNCLGESTVILPGQEIFVPDLATHTPTATATSIPLAPSNTSLPPQPIQVEYQPPVEEVNNQPEPAEQVVTPTPVPPTPAPPITTAVPPSPKPPKVVPPTAQPKNPPPPPPPPNDDDNNRRNRGKGKGNDNNDDDDDRNRGRGRGIRNGNGNGNGGNNGNGNGKDDNRGKGNNGKDDDRGRRKGKGR